MRPEESANSKEETRRNGHGKGKGRSPHGAKTFRRGRALAFLERMKLKRSTLHQQLEKPEFEPIQQVLLGELKAIDLMISEFTQLFEIHEEETNGQTADISAESPLLLKDKEGTVKHEENQ